MSCVRHYHLGVALYIFPSDSHTARQVQEPMLNGRIALCSVSSSTLMFHHLRFHLCHVQNGSASACLITDADFSALPTCWCMRCDPASPEHFSQAQRKTQLWF